MILQALKEYYDRKATDKNSGIPPLGWDWKRIPFLLDIDATGKFHHLENTQQRDNQNHLVARPFLVPILGESKGSGIKSNIPWENAEYIFGIPIKEDKNNLVPKRRQAFIARLKEYASYDWAQAILSFLENINVALITNSYPNEWSNILKGDYIIFSINGNPVSNIDSFKQAYKSLYNGQMHICLATGQLDLIKDKEPAIRGNGFLKITPTQKIQSELHLVSFNETSFTSFNKKQGQNAPIGQIASLAYTTALNTLLVERSRQKLLIGDATTVFWASKPTTLENDFADMFSEPPEYDPNRNCEAVERLFSSVKTGAFIHEKDETRFYVLGLSPNVARIAVRFWHDGTVAEMEQRFADWFENLRIVHSDKEREHLSLWRLLCSLASQGKTENIPPNLAGAVMRSILEGTLYPTTLLSSALVRIKAEHNVGYPRAKLIKAFLNHNYKRKLTMSLDKDNTNIGYRLGRLFAMLEKIQEIANPGINATIRDKFYASASATPMAVFGNLMRLSGHHLSKLDSEKKGLRIWLEKQVEEIMSEISSFPAHLSLEDQGMFAIGYYHQHMAKKDDMQSTMDSEEKK